MYHVLREGTDYRNLGEHYYEQQRHILLRSVKRLERLGYVTLQMA